MDGIGGEDMNIGGLVEGVKKDEVKEVILGMNGKVEGECSGMYICRLVKGIGIKVRRVGEGLCVGGDLEYGDEVSLCKAIGGRREM